MIFHGSAFIGSYDDRLVGLSIVIANLASCAALDVAGGGASAMGTGTWSMHSIGIEAMRLPAVCGSTQSTRPLLIASVRDVRRG